MPTDPVSNPQLPRSSTWTPSSSALESQSPRQEHERERRHRRGRERYMRHEQAAGSSAAALTAGLVAGALAGAAVALMFAPRRGREVRSSIRHFASDRRQQMTRLMETGRTRAGDAVHRASHLLEKGRHAFRRRERSWPTGTSSTSSTSSSGAQPLTASVAEISAADRRFEEPLGG